MPNAVLCSEVASIQVASIHRAAESTNSRKLVFKPTNPYPIGPGQCGTSHPDKRGSQDILIHAWIDIHSNPKNLRHQLERPRGSPVSPVGIGTRHVLRGRLWGVSRRWWLDFRPSTGKYGVGLGKLSDYRVGTPASFPLFRELLTHVRHLV